MRCLLAALRDTAPPPEGLLAGLPGCRIWYLDDERGDPAKAAWEPSLDPVQARRKQSEGCGVFCTLSAFAPPPAVGEIGPTLALAVEVDLARPGEQPPPTPPEMDLRKELYLRRYLLRFPLLPHWLVETRGGFQLVFRIATAASAARCAEALRVSRSLADALLGDPGACGLLQHVRVPGWWQRGRPGAPFLCRLLADRTGRCRPYRLSRLRKAAERYRRGQRPLSRLDRWARTTRT